VKTRWRKPAQGKQIWGPNETKSHYPGQVFRMLCTRFYAQGCTFNAQGSRLIILIVHVRRVRISIPGAMEAFEKKEGRWNSLYPKTDGVLSFHPHLNANVLFASFFSNLTPCMTKLRVLVLCPRLFWKDYTKYKIPVKTKSTQIISNNNTLQWPDFLLLNFQN
jgi:hypothetical protein